jgi:hypothetical protein
MKKINTASSLAKIDKAEKEVAKLTTFLKTTSGQKFVNNIHKERIDVLCKRYHLNYIVYTNLTTTMNVVNSVVNKLGLKPENNAKEAVEKLTEQHHPQPKRLTLHTKKIIKDGKIERIKSEISKFNIKIDTSNKLTHKELLNGYKIHKLDKWLVKNPEPIEQDSTGQLNAFYETDHEEWKKKLELIKVQIEDKIIYKYNPNLPLIVRYKSSEQSYVSKKLTSIPDKENTAKNINNLSDEDNIIKLAKAKVNEEKAKNPKLVAGYLRDHNNQFGRVIIPAA